MKARRITLHGLPTPQSAMHRIISVRFAEVLAQAPALRSQNAKELHALRISCKRLRYSIELFLPELPRLEQAGERIRQLQDELGEVHDCDVLRTMATGRNAPHLAHRLGRDRERHALRAAALWVDAFSERGPFAELVAYTGFGIPAA